jgi:hypothetical protein
MKDDEILGACSMYEDVKNLTILNLRTRMRVVDTKTN